MTMPRSLQEILEHADELGRRFEEHEPSDVRDAAPLHAIREAVTERAATERRVAEAVAAAREAGVSWSAIGSMLGTSGEAARKRYAGLHIRSA
jgi:FAD/FMN-containing dehydrogenase